MNATSIKMELIEIFKSLIPYGYKCYSTSKGEGEWGSIITPSDNVLHIYFERSAGWKFSFQYPSSHGNGSGCMCLVHPVPAVTLETIQEAEYEGWAFASRLRADFYRNSDEWLRKYWAAESLELVSLVDEKGA